MQGLELKGCQKVFGSAQEKHAIKNSPLILTIWKTKMPAYKCFKCGKKVTNTVLEKRFVCNECGSKIFYKPRSQLKKIKTD